MFKKIFEFAFQSETYEIFKDLGEVRESAIYSWEERKILSCVLLWIIFSMFFVVTCIIGAFELAIMGIWTVIRGIILLVFALIAEVLSVGIR